VALTPAQGEAIEPVAPDDNPVEPAPRKIKRARLLLDVRTELTDDELKVGGNAVRGPRYNLLFV
jgi:meiotic recombination protein REC8